MKNNVKHERLRKVLQKALNIPQEHKVVLLDAYDNAVITNGISCTITTRISASCHHYLLFMEDD